MVVKYITKNTQKLLLYIFLTTSWQFSEEDHDFDLRRDTDHSARRDHRSDAAAAILADTYHEPPNIPFRSLPDLQSRRLLLKLCN